jgi:hypothetical protein
MDLDGHVTRDSLGACGLPHLMMIARSFGCQKKFKTRDPLITYILAHHPKAAEGRLEAKRVKAVSARKRKRENPFMTKYEVRQMKRQTKEIVADLFAHGEEPEFHALYRSSYGLQDRFNAIIYKCFKFQNA